MSFVNLKREAIVNRFKLPFETSLCNLISSQRRELEK